MAHKHVANCQFEMYVHNWNNMLCTWYNSIFSGGPKQSEDVEIIEKGYLNPNRCHKVGQNHESLPNWEMRR